MAGNGKTTEHKVTWRAGFATTAAATTEVAALTDYLAGATSTAASAISHALRTGIGSKRERDPRGDMGITFSGLGTRLVVALRYERTTKVWPTSSVDAGEPSSHSPQA